VAVSSLRDGDGFSKFSIKPSPRLRRTYSSFCDSALLRADFEDATVPAYRQILPISVLKR